MFCDEALEAVEPIAAGDLKPEGRIAEHLASCPNCAAALADAEQVDQLLRARSVPAPPVQFTSRTLTRIRRARWRSDQVLDFGFNAALLLVFAGAVGLVWTLMARTGLAAVATDVTDLFSSGFAALARQVFPSLPLYIAASALVGVALGVWWWAEAKR